jgi:hypothetical protein
LNPATARRRADHRPAADSSVLEPSASEQPEMLAVEAMRQRAHAAATGFASRSSCSVGTVATLTAPVRVSRFSDSDGWGGV